MWFLSGLFGGERWEQDSGAPAGSAGAAVQVQVPAGGSATVEATPPAEGAEVAAPARNEAGRFVAGPGTTVEVTTPPAPIVPPPAGLNAEQLATLRGALVEANPHAVPELIAGNSFEALIASVPMAREAHSRVAAEVAEAAAGSVTRGGGAAAGVDVETLSGEAKIGLGLQQGRQR